MNETSRMQVEEIVLDFRGWRGQDGQFDTWLDRLKEYSSNASAIAHTAISHILFGSATCEKMLLQADTDELLRRMDYAAEHGLELMVELPPVHQRYRTKLTAFLRRLTDSVPIHAGVVNDIGGALLIQQSFPDMLLHAGRAFDKTVRENRFDIRELPEFEKHFSMIATPALAENSWQMLFRQLGISRITVDTLPDGKLLLPICQTGWDVIYPCITVSKMAKCEYAEHCRNGCRLYQKQYSGTNRGPMYRLEHAVVCMQTKALENAVSGTFRLIYSCL